MSIKAVNPGGQPERRIGRVLKSQSLGRRRVTFVVRQPERNHHVTFSRTVNNLREQSYGSLFPISRTTTHPARRVGPGSNGSGKRKDVAGIPKNCPRIGAVRCHLFALCPSSLVLHCWRRLSGCRSRFASARGASIPPDAKRTGSISPSAGGCRVSNDGE